MATRKQNLVVTIKRPEIRLVVLTCGDAEMQDIKAIEGVEYIPPFDSAPHSVWVFIDARYDFDEVVAEIEALNTPQAIPVEFTEWR